MVLGQVFSTSQHSSTPSDLAVIAQVFDRAEPGLTGSVVLLGPVFPHLGQSISVPMVGHRKVPTVRSPTLVYVLVQTPQTHHHTITEPGHSESLSWQVTVLLSPVLEK